MAAEVIAFPAEAVFRTAPAALRGPAEAYLDLRSAATALASVFGPRRAAETLLSLAVEMEDRSHASPDP